MKEITKKFTDKISAAEFSDKIMSILRREIKETTDKELKPFLDFFNSCKKSEIIFRKIDRGIEIGIANSEGSPLSDFPENEN